MQVGKGFAEICNGIGICSDMQLDGNLLQYEDRDFLKDNHLQQD